MQGFFSQSSFVQVNKYLGKSRCDKCGLFQHCQSQKMPPSGKGKARIMVVGDYPGKYEDKKGKAFVGESGMLVEEILDEYGIDFRKDCRITNALICKPTDPRNVKKREIDYCRPNLIKEVREFNPELIILMGGAAVESLIGYLWKEGTGGITRWAGWRIPCQELNAWICPTFNPAFILRARESKQFVAEKLFRWHIRSALDTQGRPWNPVPDWKKEVTCFFSDREAAKAITDMVVMAEKQGDVPIAFDYETNMLKPDSRRAQIVSCSMSTGYDTASFLWGPKVMEVMREFLKSDIPKIASNLDMEERWTRKFFGRGVRNWWIDTMNRAHVLDNRKGITGLKFQAFALFGVGDYDSHIKKYLKSQDDNSNTPNRIHKIDKRELLIYNGMDSLLEWKVAMKQTEHSKPK